MNKEQKADFAKNVKERHREIFRKKMDNPKIQEIIRRLAGDQHKERRSEMTEKFDYRLVKITWQDSRHPYDGWVPVKDMVRLEPTICETVGWLIKEESGLLVVASSITTDSDGDTQVSGVVDIPSRSVDAIVDFIDFKKLPDGQPADDPLRRYADHERPGPVCYDCRRDYGTFPDLLVSDDVWEKINPTYHHGCGILCPTCMAVRVSAAGLDEVPAAFVSGAFVSGVLASKLGEGIRVASIDEAGSSADAST